MVSYKLKYQQTHLFSQKPGAYLPAETKALNSIINHF